MKKQNRTIILASRSPRRRQLFKRLGVSFRVVEPRAEEVSPRRTSAPGALVMRNALTKARWVSSRFPDAVIIGADTIVFQKGRVFGKPGSLRAAHRMLLTLKRAPHWVYTGVALIDTKRAISIADYEKTKVYFRDISDKAVERYFTVTSPLDKAGGYAIQENGDLLIRRIEGDFFNVVGLPLVRVDELLMGVLNAGCGNSKKRRRYGAGLDHRR
ncbi:MAG: septum formation protein Maf [Candidatus Omnitrophica bacterium]|nr:septum formation protein Maf [Candidatus Omnitrophota bacterium]